MQQSTEKCAVKQCLNFGIH